MIKFCIWDLLMWILDGFGFSVFIIRNLVWCVVVVLIYKVIVLVVKFFLKNIYILLLMDNIN